MVEQGTENPRVIGSIPIGGTICGLSSSGRAPPCQGGGSEFEPRSPLHTILCRSLSPAKFYLVPWPSGKAKVCKTFIPQFKSGWHLQAADASGKSRAHLFFALASFCGPCPAKTAHFLRRLTSGKLAHIMNTAQCILRGVFKTGKPEFCGKGKAL